MADEKAVTVEEVVAAKEPSDVVAIAEDEIEANGGAETAVVDAAVAAEGADLEANAAIVDSKSTPDTVAAAAAAAETQQEAVVAAKKLTDCKWSEVGYFTTSSEDEGEEHTQPAAKRAKIAAASLVRRFHKIPIYVADYHNDVMKFVYQCFGSRLLPLENNLLVHFDSHPDMVLSSTIPASTTRSRKFMLETLCIENWIMPSLYTGQFNRVVWLKQSFCQQMPVGTYKFKIGQCNDNLRVDCPLEYFIQEGSYVDTAQLQQTRDVELRVFDVTADAPTGSDFVPDDSTYVLDIDLDYFSCRNPFRSLYEKVNCLQRISSIFALQREADESNASYSARRAQRIQSLESLFGLLEEERSLNVDSYKAELDADTLQQISALIADIQREYTDDEVNWNTVYDAGCTTDGNGLPHQISTEQQLLEAYRNFDKLLRTLPKPPVLITIARSHSDDYCPQEQSNEILDDVQDILHDVFGEQLLQEPIVHESDDDIDLRPLYYVAD